MAKRLKTGKSYAGIVKLCLVDAKCSMPNDKNKNIFVVPPKSYLFNKQTVKFVFKAIAFAVAFNNAFITQALTSSLISNMSATALIDPLTT